MSLIVTVFSDNDRGKQVFIDGLPAIEDELKLSPNRPLEPLDWYQVEVLPEIYCCTHDTPVDPWIPTPPDTPQGVMQPGTVMLLGIGLILLSLPKMSAARRQSPGSGDQSGEMPAQPDNDASMSGEQVEALQPSPVYPDPDARTPDELFPTVLRPCSTP